MATKWKPKLDQINVKKLNNLKQIQAEFLSQILIIWLWLNLAHKLLIFI